MVLDKFTMWLGKMGILLNCMVVWFIVLVVVTLVRKSDNQTSTVRDIRAVPTASPKTGNQTKLIDVQASLYIATFVFTWVFGTASRASFAISPTPCVNFGLMWLHSLFVPLQGFGNYIVCIYPRIWEAKRDAKLAARQRAHTQTTRTPLQAVKDFAIRAYKVVFQVGPILSGNVFRSVNRLRRQPRSNLGLKRNSSAFNKTNNTKGSLPPKQALPLHLPKNRWWFNLHCPNKQQQQRTRVCGTTTRQFSHSNLQW